jgi:hypothetical protein
MTKRDRIVDGSKNQKKGDAKKRKERDRKVALARKGG